MAPIRGWAPRGQRLQARVPHGHWKTLTLIAALRCDRIDAPCVFDGPINGRSFTAYVEQVLVPTLVPGDIVILDNLGSHKGQPVREAIRRAGAKLFFLPPYSPDLNPIEQVLPSSSNSCVPPPHEPSRQHGKPQETCSNASNQTNAETTSSMQDTLQRKIIGL